MTRRKLTATFALFASLLSFALTGGAQDSPTPNSISDAQRKDLEYLASDELRGRGVTDDSIHVAGEYIAERMRAIGLQTDAAGGTPFQTVEIPVGSELNSREKNFCNVDLPGGESLQAVVDDGFGPLAIGLDQASASGRVVFAGYGITSKTHNYDDYAQVDAKGAVVILIRKEPGISDPDSPFDGVRNTRHAFFATKIANAIAHGAAAVLMVNDPQSTRESVQEVQNRINQERARKERLEKLLEKLPAAAVKNRADTEEKIAGSMRMMESMQTSLETARRGVLGISQAGTKTRQSAKLPVGSIARDLADRLLVAAGQKSLEAIEQQIDETFQPASRSLPGISATVSVDLKPAAVTSNNVIGMLPGKGALASQTLVVGAHYDHVGMGGFGSLAPGTVAVHNGADDNASGTVTMLACAATLKKQLAESPNHRTVLFIAFTGEERGLLGSKHYVANPIRPIGSTAAMINLDMVGRLRDNELTVYGTGTAPGLETLLDEANAVHQFNLFKVASGYGPSDHESFYRRRVPVLFFFTGLHNDYHRPSDDFDKIDLGSLSRVTDMVCDVAFRLAVRPDRPTYAETDRRVQIRRQMTAVLGVRLSQRNRGVQIVDVTEGGPASKAGLQIDDIIQRIGDSPIRQTSDVLGWVRAHSPGDQFEIQVLRNATLVTLRGKLEKRVDN